MARTSSRSACGSPLTMEYRALMPGRFEVDALPAWSLLSPRSHREPRAHAEAVQDLVLAVGVVGVGPEVAAAGRRLDGADRPLAVIAAGEGLDPVQDEPPPVGPRAVLRGPDELPVPHEDPTGGTRAAHVRDDGIERMRRPLAAQGLRGEQEELVDGPAAVDRDGDE